MLNCVTAGRDRRNALLYCASGAYGGDRIRDIGHCERRDLSAVAQRAKAEAIHRAAKKEWIASCRQIADP
jgi:hypothetical protein